MSGRRLREVSVVLGLVLAAMLGVIIVVFISQPGPGPAASSTPTLFAGATPLGTTHALTPTAPASVTAGPTDGATPTGPPASSPTGETPSAAVCEIDLLDVGLDTTDTGGEDEPPLARHFTVVVDGPGRIEATVQAVSFGRVRMCLGQGDPSAVTDEECQAARRPALQRDISAAGPTTWTVSLVGSQAGASPTVDLRLRWPTSDARIALSGFRFQGSEIENYNGFVAEVEADLDGLVDVDATFDDGQGAAYPYRLIIEQVGGGSAQVFVAESEGAELHTTSEMSGSGRYRITLEGRHSVADQRVLLTAELDWP